MPEIQNWQPIVLTVRGPKKSCWLVKYIADVYVYNNKKLIIDFIENSIKVRGLTLDDILPSREKVEIKLKLKDGIEGLVFILTNVFYLLNSSFNFISLGLLNNIRIYHHNED